MIHGTYKTSDGRLFVFGETVGTMVQFVTLDDCKVYWATERVIQNALANGQLVKIG